METIMRIRSYAAALCALTTRPALAQDIRYSPFNPSFGGSPFNGATLLDEANAQNKQVDPRSTKQHRSPSRWWATTRATPQPGATMPPMLADAAKEKGKRHTA